MPYLYASVQRPPPATGRTHGDDTAFERASARFAAIFTA